MTLTVWNTHRYSTPNNTNSLNTLFIKYFYAFKRPNEYKYTSIQRSMPLRRCIYSCILLIFRPYVKF